MANKMIYVDGEMEVMIRQVSKLTDDSFSNVMKKALRLWIESQSKVPEKDPVRLLYEAIEIIRSKK